MTSLPTTREQVDMLYNNLEIFQSLGAYTNTLDRLSAVEGAAKIRSMHNVMKRLQRYRQSIVVDFDTQLDVLQRAKRYYATLGRDHEGYDATMPAYIQQHIQRLEQTKSSFREVINTQGDRQVQALEALLHSQPNRGTTQQEQRITKQKSSIGYLSILFIIGFVVALLVSVFLSTDTAQALAIPSPQGQGLVYRLGVTDEVDEREEKELERLLADYQSETNNELAIVLIDNTANYARSFSDMIAQLKANGYQPNALLLVTDFATRQTHLSVNATLEYGDVWSDASSRYIVERILPESFRKSKYTQGLKTFIEYTEDKLPEDVNILRQEQVENRRLQEEVTGKNVRQSVFYFMIVLGVLLAILAARYTYRSIRFKKYTQRLQAFVGTNIPMYKADIQGLLEGDITDVSERFMHDTASELQYIESDIINYIEHSEQTYEEAQKLYEKAEAFENGFTAFINNPEVHQEKLHTVYKQRDTAEQKRKQTLEEINL